ncbi:hypothetical protein GQ473_05225 [archaeon]|nr:hypothetical protein [archaeon]
MVSLTELSDVQIEKMFRTSMSNGNHSIPKIIILELYNEMLRYQQSNSAYTIEEITTGVQTAIESKYVQKMLSCFTEADDLMKTIGAKNEESYELFLEKSHEIESFRKRKNEIMHYLPDTILSLSMYLCAGENSGGVVKFSTLPIMIKDIYRKTITTLGDGFKDKTSIPV